MYIRHNFNAQKEKLHVCVQSCLCLYIYIGGCTKFSTLRNFGSPKISDTLFKLYRLSHIHLIPLAVNHENYFCDNYATPTPFYFSSDIDINVLYIILSNDYPTCKKCFIKRAIYTIYGNTVYIFLKTIKIILPSLQLPIHEKNT